NRPLVTGLLQAAPNFFRLEWLARLVLFDDLERCVHDFFDGPGLPFAMRAGPPAADGEGPLLAARIDDRKIAFMAEWTFHATAPRAPRTPVILTLVGNLANPARDWREETAGDSIGELWHNTRSAFVGRRDVANAPFPRCRIMIRVKGRYRNQSLELDRAL